MLSFFVFVLLVLYCFNALHAEGVPGGVELFSSHVCVWSVWKRRSLKFVGWMSLYSTRYQNYLFVNPPLVAVVQNCALDYPSARRVRKWFTGSGRFQSVIARYSAYVMKVSSLVSATVTRVRRDRSHEHSPKSLLGEKGDSSPSNLKACNLLMESGRG